jgi:SAM-dependent methyltransferase
MADLRGAGPPEAPYGGGFHRNIREGSLRSAREIVPVLLDLLGPRSVADVGCGDGTWLAVFREQGIVDTLGLDGTWVDPAQLAIPAESFRAVDLSRPLMIGRRFDLVLCLEVAEHLPVADAPTLVDSLARLGDVVAFSAAIPSQGGRYHVNEQWPEYWAALFDARGYAPVDCLRERLWANEGVEWWYAQNMLLFATGTALERHAALAEGIRRRPRPPALVHPRNYLEKVQRLAEASDPRRWSLRQVLGALPTAARNALRRRLT